MYWLTHDTAETNGFKQGEGRRIQPFYQRITNPCDLWPFLHFSQTAGAHWLADAVHPVGIITACHAMSRFNRTAMLKHDLFEMSNEN